MILVDADSWPGLTVGEQGRWEVYLALNGLSNWDVNAIYQDHFDNKGVFAKVFLRHSDGRVVAAIREDTNEVWDAVTDMIPLRYGTPPGTR